MRIKAFTLLAFLFQFQVFATDSLHHHHIRLLKELKPYSKLQVTHGKMDRLEGNFDHLTRQIDELDKDLEIAQKLLEIPGEVEGDLKEIHKLLTHIGHGAKVVSVIPQIHTQAEELADACEKLDQPVNETKKVVHGIKKAVDPILKMVKLFRKKLKSFRKNLHKAQKKIIPPVARKMLGGAQCLDKVQGNKQKDCVLKKASPELNAMNLAYDELNQGFESYFKELEKLENILSKIVQPLSALADFSVELGQFKIALHKIDIPLKKLMKFLKKKFYFTLEVPTPTLKNPFHVKKVHIGISVDIIVQGIHKIELEIKKRLEGLLFKIAKDLGLKKLAKKLIRAMKKELKKLLKSVILTIEADFPGMKMLLHIEKDLQILWKDLETLLKIDLPDFNKPDLGLSNFHPRIDLSIPSFKKMGFSFHETCCDLGAKAVCQ